jgi:hypothetical protein
MQSQTAHHLDAAASYFSRSMKRYENPETAYFQGKAAMEANEWDAAISSFEWITKNKAQVYIDSIGSLIPLAEYNLSICYKQTGNDSEAMKHLTEAHAWWPGVDLAVRKQAAETSK